MKRVQCIIEFQLSCSWAGETAPSYRVYFDNELLTERTYVWDSTKQIVQKRVAAWLEEGTTHLITLIKVDSKTGIENDTFSDGIFTVTNVTRQNADNVEFIVLTW